MLYQDCSRHLDSSKNMAARGQGLFSLYIYIEKLKIFLSETTGPILIFDLIMLRFNDTSTLVGHFVSSSREREKRDRRDSRRDEREGQGRKRNRNESEETEEIETSPPYPYLLQG